MEMWGENVVWILFLRRAKCCKIRLMADKRKSDLRLMADKRKSDLAFC